MREDWKEIVKEVVVSAVVAYTGMKCGQALAKVTSSKLEQWKAKKKEKEKDEQPIDKDETFSDLGWERF